MGRRGEGWVVMFLNRGLDEVKLIDIITNGHIHHARTDCLYFGSVRRSFSAR